MTSHIHHLNCVTMHPRASFGGRVTPPRMVAHCLLVETDDGLVLVDTGFGTADLAEKRMGTPFVVAMGVDLDPAATAVAQVRALGHDPADVTDIVVTHLDLDHAGGLGDFPGARVHVFADELDAARRRATLTEKQRYVPAQWAHGPQWVEHAVAGEDWLGLESVAVAVRRPAGGWFVHGGDAYFFHGEKDSPPTCPSGLRAFQRIMSMDEPARQANQDRLRSLHADHGPHTGSAESVTLFSAHDAAEYDALAGVTD